jgi:hypothetical protein
MFIFVSFGHGLDGVLVSGLWATAVTKDGMKSFAELFTDHHLKYIQHCGVILSRITVCKI